jgi:mRNA interferase HigB
VISRKPLLEFGREYTDAVAPLDAWYRTALRAKWRNLVEAREDFRHADKVGERTVFNIAGNKYRLIARVNYETQRIFVLAILTHSRYDEESWKK